MVSPSFRRIRRGTPVQRSVLSEPGRMSSSPLTSPLLAPARKSNTIIHQVQLVMPLAIPFRTRFAGYARAFKLCPVNLFTDPSGPDLIPELSITVKGWSLLCPDSLDTCSCQDPFLSTNPSLIPVVVFTDGLNDYVARSTWNTAGFWAPGAMARAPVRKKTC